jgi:hypothetical protein
VVRFRSRVLALAPNVKRRQTFRPIRHGIIAESIWLWVRFYFILNSVDNARPLDKVKEICPA